LRCGFDRISSLFFGRGHLGCEIALDIFIDLFALGTPLLLRRARSRFFIGRSTGFLGTAVAANTTGSILATLGSRRVDATGGLLGERGGRRSIP